MDDVMKMNSVTILTLYTSQRSFERAVVLLATAAVLYYSKGHECEDIQFFHISMTHNYV
jgi:hypothetical protein